MKTKVLSIALLLLCLFQLQAAMQLRYTNNESLQYVKDNNIANVDEFLSQLERAERVDIPHTWNDKDVIIPWELYFRTGDTGVLEDNYLVMVKWVNYCTSQPVGHTLDIGFFGDWLQPFTQNECAVVDVYKELIKMAYYAHSVDLISKSIRVLCRIEETKHYSLLHDSIKEAFEQRFFDIDGRAIHSVETQPHYLVALEFGLFSEETKAKSIVHLKRLLGVYDLMCHVLFKETFSSWFYSIN